MLLKDLHTRRHKIVNTIASLEAGSTQQQPKMLPSKPSSAGIYIFLNSNHSQSCQSMGQPLRETDSHACVVRLEV